MWEVYQDGTKIQEHPTRDAARIAAAALIEAGAEGITYEYEGHAEDVEADTIALPYSMRPTNTP